MNEEIRFEKADLYLFIAFGVGLLILLLLAFFETGCGGVPFTVGLRGGEIGAPDASPAEAGGAPREAGDVGSASQDASEPALDATPGPAEAATDTSLPETSISSCDTSPSLPWGCNGCAVDPASCVLVCHSCTASDGHLFLWPSLQLPCPAGEYIAVDNGGRLVCK